MFSTRLAGSMTANCAWATWVLEDPPAQGSSDQTGEPTELFFIVRVSFRSYEFRPSCVDRTSVPPFTVSAALSSPLALR